MSNDVLFRQIFLKNMKTLEFYNVMKACVCQGHNDNSEQIYALYYYNTCLTTSKYVKVSVNSVLCQYYKNVGRSIKVDTV